jgi:hypothetical protein
MEWRASKWPCYDLLGHNGWCRHITNDGDSISQCQRDMFEVKGGINQRFMSLHSAPTPLLHGEGEPVWRFVPETGESVYCCIGYTLHMMQCNEGAECWLRWESGAAWVYQGMFSVHTSVSAECWRESGGVAGGQGLYSIIHGFVWGPCEVGTSTLRRGRKC